MMHKNNILYSVNLLNDKIIRTIIFVNINIHFLIHRITT